MLFVAIGIKLTSPGPVLFKQNRYGLNGKQIGVEISNHAGDGEQRGGHASHA